MPESEKGAGSAGEKGGKGGGFVALLVILAAAYAYMHFVAHAAVKIGHYVVR